MNSTCEFQAGSLTGVSYRDQDVDALLSREFDLVIVVSSWEDRVRSLLKCSGITARAAVLILYDETDAEGLRTANDVLLKAFLRERCENLDVITTSATDLAGTWTALFERIILVYHKLGRPLRILLDASTCQRYHILALLSNGFTYAMVQRLSVFYAEGLYPDKPERDEVVFGDGVWRSAPA